jgi:threonine dehydratase
VIAGNGTIGLELVEQLDDIDAVLIPWGGGGLTTGVASALHALSPETKVYVCEPETGAPVAGAIANGRVATPVPFTPSFVDGAGSGSLLPEMWEHARDLVTDAFPISLEATADAVRLLIERGRLVAEGAAALPVAAALAGAAGSGRVVCIVSGGNIDSARLVEILSGRVPA